MVSATQCRIACDRAVRECQGAVVDDATPLTGSTVGVPRGAVGTFGPTPSDLEAGDGHRRVGGNCVGGNIEHAAVMVAANGHAPCHWPDDGQVAANFQFAIG